MADTTSEPPALGLALLVQRVSTRRDYSKVAGPEHYGSNVWSEEELDGLADLVEQGLKIKEIQQYFPHRTRSAITTRIWSLRRHGIIASTKGKKGKADEYFQQTEYMLKQGYEAKEIAEALGLKYSTLRGWLGLWRIRGMLPPVRVKWSKEKKKQLISLRDRGLTRKEIAEEMGIVQTSVGGMIDRMIRKGEIKRLRREA